MKPYDFKVIEQKWRAAWQKTSSLSKLNSDKPKFYCLDMFPYPSASGLHVGHWRGYVLSDVLCRYKILQGYEVLHPMGWDAFGLPAENYAIKQKIHPAVSTAECIANAKRQLQEISAVYDWDREVNTTSPEYYKWTQWIFLQMYKHGLAYEKDMPLNWCPNCKAVLANEEATSGKCDRCGNDVTKKQLRQWMLKITEYAERLADDLQNLDWPEKVKKMQLEWIGKSHGANIMFKLDTDDAIEVFTTRPDTIFGVTFIVLAPEHPLVKTITSSAQRNVVDDYVRSAANKTTVERMADKDKTGVFTGVYAINPMTKTKIPVWIADYVLADYGTGAIMCVPAHDERDHDFAMKFNLPIVSVFDNDVMINSGEFDGTSCDMAKETILQKLIDVGCGKSVVSYKLRDWIFSRQRYWGEPIPIIHCPKCKAVPVPENELPVLLPNVEHYEPTDTGESPLAKIDSWVNVTCPICKGPARRETNTMPQWAGSSWYFLRYADPHNESVLADKNLLKKWLPVDYYVGGIEHAVLHLLYARFYTKFLYDIGVVDFTEPFTKLFNQGMINKNKTKMSKSKGNVVSPDELVNKYGCDALRLYELFVGPPELDCEWNDKGIDGVFRYLNRLWKFVSDCNIVEPNQKLIVIRNKMVYEITNRIESLSMNTIVSGFMEFTNELMKLDDGIDIETLDALIIMLSPFAPHIAEELWQMRNDKSVFEQSWPVYDKDNMTDNSIVIALQINGKLRGNITAHKSDTSEQIILLAKETLASRLTDKTIVKEIYVPGKIINFVVR